jgi:hypothetical protein
MNASLGNSGLDERPPVPRKIKLDSDVYCPHSLQASDGNVDCDHDFEPAPTLAGANFAVWTCTKCRRAFKYEVWQAHRRLT